MNNNSKIPSNLNDCFKPSPIYSYIKSWAKRIEIIGFLLMLIIFIYGLITSIINSYVPVANGFIIRDEFSFGLFLNIFTPYIIYLVISFIALVFIKMILLGLASIIYNTSLSAKIAALQVSNSPIEQDNE